MKLLKILTGIISVFVVPSVASAAVCAVCVVGVGAGLAFADKLGVDYSIIGLWAGGLTLALTLLTANWLKKKNVNNIWLYFVLPFVVYYATLFSVYLFPDVIVYGQWTLFGMDKVLLGIILGTIAFYIGARQYSKISKKNGGKSQYPFQKVIVPIEYLIGANVLLWLTIRYIAV